eukprot:gene7623-8917_t
MDWKVTNTFSEKNLMVGVDLELNDDDYSRKIWPFSFTATYTVILHSNRLELGFKVTNKDSKPFDIQLALHTYFSISDIANIHVEGLHNYKYLDKMKNAAIELETRKQVTIGEEVDRVYMNINHQIPIEIIDNKSKIVLRSETTLTDAVLWNPWIEKSKKMEDYGDEEYHRMVCIEAGVVSSPPIVPVGESFATKHTITPVNIA